MGTPLDWGNNMFDSRLIVAIKGAEGCRLTAYKDSEGLWTIGYGHLLAQDSGHNWEGYAITQELADQWFMDDLKAARAEVLKLGLVGVSGARLSAFVELMFNLGPKRLAGFHKMWAAVAARDWIEASRQLLDSKWAGQVGPTRSARIAELIQVGAYA